MHPRHNTASGPTGSWWDACWRNDLLDRVGWALALIWGGLVLLGDLTAFAGESGRWDAWAVFFAGAGVIVLAATAVRALTPEFRRGVEASLIFGLVLLSIGLGEAIAWIWVIVLVAVGGLALRGAMGARK